MSSVFALVAFSALALAQTRPPDIECRKTETQAECHTRLKCKANEELEDCQKRLLKCRAGEKLDDCKKRAGTEPAKDGNAGQRNNADRKGDDRDAARNGRNTDDTGRDREADNESRRREREREQERERERERERENVDRERSERDHRDRDEGARPRRERGDRQADDGERRRGGGGGGSRKGFQPNKTFGLGLELGEPTGLNGKYFLSRSGALDFGIGLIYGHYYYGDGFHIYADYLWHPISLASASAFELPFYIGGGLRFWNFQYCFQGVCDYGGSALGIRVPIGIAFDFNHVPLDIFIQVVPVIDFVSGNYYDRFRDRTHVGIDLSAGIRYWFK